MNPPPPDSTLPGPRARGRRLPPAPGFTLVELLVVMGIIAAILAFSVPALNSMRNAGEVSKTIYDFAGILAQSRTYAMANNTYVYVGFGETDATSSTSGRQDFTGDKVGRISVAAVATKDGTPGYDPNAASIGDSWNQAYQNGKNLLTIGKVQTFTNIHLAYLGDPPADGSMARPPYASTSATDREYYFGSPDYKEAVTRIYYPPGSSTGSANYTFTKVIQFDPQGTARIVRNDNAGGIPKQIEIGLEPARGNVAAPLTGTVRTGNVAALQIDGMMGSTRVYRP